MENGHKIEIELVEHSPGTRYSGIGRYTQELYHHLSPYVAARLTTHVDPPFTRYISFFHHLPVGIQAHREGNIIHFMEDLGCSQMLWRPKRPAIATSHDLGMLVWPPEARMHRPLDRLIWYLSYLGLKRMDALITVSEFSRQMVIRRLGLPAERVFTVHSGIDTTLFKPVADARARLAKHYGFPNDTHNKNLLYVGTEIPRKNLVTLLKTLARLPSNVRLLKVGAAGGPRFREATNRTIAELGLTDRVIFFDKVSDEDLILLYNIADVYICCSFLEGFGHPILEAMACGTPVVCSNVTSLPEIAGDAAVLVPPQNDEAFAEAVMTILSKAELREEMATRGLQQAAAFSWEQTAQAVLAVYRQVASGNGDRVKFSPCQEHK